MEGAFVKAQAAYRESAPEAGGPLCVRFEGSLTAASWLELRAASGALAVSFVRAKTP